MPRRKKVEEKHPVKKVTLNKLASKNNSSALLQFNNWSGSNYKTGDTLNDHDLKLINQFNHLNEVEHIEVNSVEYEVKE